MNAMIEFFNFEFLKKLDRYVLLNHTLVWNIKLHYIVFWSLVMNIPLIAFLFFYPVELYEVPAFYEMLIGFLDILLPILVLYWLYPQYKYNAVKEYSKCKFNGLKEYLLYFCVILIIFSTPLINKYIISNLYTNNIIVEFKDIKKEEVKQISQKNSIFFIYIKARNYFWIYMTILFLPLFMIFYKTMTELLFKQSFLLAFALFILTVFLGSFSMIDDYRPNIFFLYGFIVIFLNQIFFRNKVQTLFLSLVYIFSFIGFLVINLNFKFLDFFIISFIFILLTISPIKHYMIKYASQPKF